MLNGSSGLKCRTLIPLMAGNSKEAAAKLNESFTRVRTTRLVPGMHLPSLAPERSRSSMKRFAHEVAL
jgi:hypothetical protein